MPVDAARIVNECHWASVVDRDAAADGGFVYAVMTTGVYCRPSCAARRPNRANVRFYASGAEAEAAGFRPCQRCRPNDAPLEARQAALIERACRLIEAAQTAPSLDALARSVGLGPSHFHRLFKALTGVTPKAYALAHRRARLRDRLSASRSVTEAIYDAGFNSSGRFYAEAPHALGMTPSAFRLGGVDAEIRFAVGDCSFGCILVAASAKGVCAVFLSDQRDALVRALQDRFPRATLLGGDPGFERLAAQVVAFVEQPEIGMDLPLDIRGTAFQHRVWTALRAIPFGATISYAELARRIGAPKAARAVAAACAANKIAVAIPCHRVLRSDGELSGYRWGAERKRKLLEREKK
ncbi:MULTISPECIES: bifunctional DNA-binding transcriptional regulator/O6-methylguanine-DNA methyltransferase Ada [Methylosinus]|uniref:methylated-DNA--[protein]-cysteine S-methyltransferase n=1 Tax=Methylosinus trichosporium (strain ATCC 35070 / NCIMB 11131 / UNIQEM 75 / OB3b) TaxID=595536 RepID=A0A2D2CUP4_METT3|nr:MULTISPECIES: bifunctional DNA-binding transcriptional regulator/O6-methylguanine-DNA methyltransferase Ada [Methylosinus]ATQ66458.1 bifunctional transcriptional activator/DNA repair protein Ada [Methylosinus trichosporium OB3b]OBS51970.1 6-O-methylguanine DNA methyltransferase [Methylosinus sp. 3S-1]